MHDAYIVDVLSFVDIQKTFKIGGKVIEVYEGVIYRENIKISPFREVIVTLFELGQKHKYEKNDVVQLLVKLIMNLRRANSQRY